MNSYVAKPVAKFNYQLQSPLKLVRGVAILAVAAILVFSGLSGANAGSETPTLERVVVSQGDTIWGLAEQFAGQADIEGWIVEFAQLNNLASSSLQPGQTLLLPAD